MLSHRQGSPLRRASRLNPYVEARLLCVIVFQAGSLEESRFRVGHWNGPLCDRISALVKRDPRNHAGCGRSTSRSQHSLRVSCADHVGSGREKPMYPSCGLINAQAETQGAPHPISKLCLPVTCFRQKGFVRPVGRGQWGCAPWDRC